MILSHYMLQVTTKSVIIKPDGSGLTYQFQTDNSITKNGNKIKASCIILGFLVFYLCEGIKREFGEEIICFFLQATA